MNLDDIKIDLETDMMNNEEFVQLMADETFCSELWTAPANTEWRKVEFEHMTDEERMYLRLILDDSMFRWSGSFRFNGGMIARIRNVHHNTNEDYMDWYCCSVDGKPYGWVSPRIMESLRKLGWVPIEDFYYKTSNT